MKNEQKAKNSTLSQAKNFINQLKLVIEDIEAAFESNDQCDQVAAVINALAINQCLDQYHSKAEEIEEMLKNQSKLN